MTTTQDRDTGWLLHTPGAVRSPDVSTVILPAGGRWDVLRTPEALALRALRPLLADPRGQHALGPVLHDLRTRSVYWWLRPGSSAAYPDGCRLLVDGDWVAVPGVRTRDQRVLTWLHLPVRAHTLTAPARLAPTLWDHGQAGTGAA